MAILDWLRQQLGGDPEAEQNAQASTAMQPTVLQHLKDAIGDVPGRLSGQSYDPSQSFAQNALNPQGIDQATTIAMMAGPGAIRAYHGSPYNFDRFDLSKIGAGEGAQAYGHGLYFAEHEPVARGYRERLGGGPNVHYSGEVTPDLRPGLDIINDVGTGRWGEVDPTTLRNRLIENYQTTVNSRLPDSSITGGRDAVRQRIEHLQALDPDKLSLKPGGHMYEVNLHADPEAFLNWDQTLRRQPSGVQAILQKLGVPEQTRNYYEGPGFRPTTGAEAYRKLGGGFTRNPDEMGRGPQIASQQLSEQGIPGIRYLDQGSRGAGDGTSNYVMFDPKKIEILRKYGIVPPVAGAGLLADQQ